MELTKKIKIILIDFLFKDYVLIYLYFGLYFLYFGLSDKLNLFFILLFVLFSTYLLTITRKNCLKQLILYWENNSMINYIIKSIFDFFIFAIIIYILYSHHKNPHLYYFTYIFTFSISIICLFTNFKKKEFLKTKLNKIKKIKDLFINILFQENTLIYLYFGSNFIYNALTNKLRILFILLFALLSTYLLIVIKKNRLEQLTLYRKNNSIIKSIFSFFLFIIFLYILTNFIYNNSNPDFFTYITSFLICIMFLLTQFKLKKQLKHN